MKSLPVLFLLTTLSTFCYGRLGDTLDQAEARYDLPKNVKRLGFAPALVDGAKELTFHFQGFRIWCAFLPATDGKEYIVREEYVRNGGVPTIKDFERDAILKAERNGMKWSEKTLGDFSIAPVKAGQIQMAHLLAGHTWYREDGAIAIHGIGGFPVRLELPHAAKWEMQIKAAKDQTERAQVPKF